MLEALTYAPSESKINYRKISQVIATVTAFSSLGRSVYTEFNTHRMDYLKIDELID